MKPRPARYEVMIKTRMRSCGVASDAHILNASQRGLLLYTLTPPRTGSYVELGVRNEVMVARVVWVNNKLFGVRTQDRVPAVLVPQLGRRTCPNVSVPAAHCASGTARLDHSRDLARRLQFISLLLFGGAAACLALASVEKTLARPLQIADSSLRFPK